MFFSKMQFRKSEELLSEKLFCLRFVNLSLHDLTWSLRRSSHWIFCSCSGESTANDPDVSQPVVTYTQKMQQRYGKDHRRFLWVPNSSVCHHFKK